MCANCATVQRLLDDSRASEKELVRTIEGLHFQLERSARAEQAARAELTKHRQESPRAQEIKSVLSHYVTRFQKTKAYKVGPDTARWKAVDRMLKMGMAVEDLKEAIDGMHALPFVGPKGRQPTDGPGCSRQDALTLCLRDEEFVDRFRGYAQKIRAAKIAEEVKEHTDRLWPPVDRVLLELRRLDIKARKADGTVLDDRRVWMFDATCPLCRKVLRVGEVFESRHGAVECAGGCDLLGVLDALHLWPSDLLGPSDPDVVWEPLRMEAA
jgi:hypothetical protein